MKLIIGLGNPGGKFAKTRHNVGHIFVANSKKLKAKSKGQAKFVKTSVFMNDSGSEVRKLLAINNQQSTINNLLIVHDDMDLPLGDFKLQRGKGAAGHKGAQSVIDALGTRDFWRLRFGIGRPLAGVEDYVLSEFSQDELERLQKVFEEAYPRVLEWAQ